MNKVLLLGLLALCLGGLIKASEPQMKSGVEKPQSTQAAENKAPAEAQLIPVYVAWIGMVVPFEEKSLEEWLKLIEKRENHGKPLFRVYRPELKAYEYLTDEQFKEYCKTRPEKTVKVRFQDSHTKISNRDLNRHDFAVYVRSKLMQNGMKQCTIYNHTDGSIEFPTDTELAHLRSLERILVRHYQCHEIANVSMTPGEYEIYKQTKVKKNGGRPCTRIKYTDKSVEYMTDEEYADYEIFKAIQAQN